jgi:hypothetical protein
LALFAVYIISTRRPQDGLAFGSVHPAAALEFVLWLIKTDYRGHVYFDTFPRNEDPVREAEYNIRAFKRVYAQAQRLLSAGNGAALAALQSRNDAMGVLEWLERDGSDGASGL